MTQIFFDGFETGDKSAWGYSTNDVTVVSTTANSGTYSAYCAPTTEYRAWMAADLSTSSQSECFARFYFKLHSAGDSQGYNVLRFLNADESSELNLWINRSGSNYYFSLNGDGISQTFSASPLISLDVWHYVEVRRKVGSGNGIISLWYDGAQIYNTTNATVLQNTKYIYFGIVYSSSYTGQIYVDDCKISDIYNGAQNSGTSLKTVTDSLATNEATFNAKPVNTGQIPQTLYLPLGARDKPFGEVYADEGNFDTLKTVTSEGTIAIHNTFIPFNEARLGVAGIPWKNSHLEDTLLTGKIEISTDAQPVSDVMPYLWGHNKHNGQWLPQFRSFEGDSLLGSSYIEFKDIHIFPPQNGQPSYQTNFKSHIFQISSPSNSDAPLIVVDQGTIVKKDLAVGGFVASEQGALALGSGLHHMLDPPAIWLVRGNDKRLPDELDAYDNHPSDPFSGQLYKNRTNNHIYHNYKGAWYDLGHKDDFDGLMDTLHVFKMTDGYQFSPHDFEYDNKYGFKTLAHLKCADFHAANIYPNISTTGNLGDIAHVWSCAYLNSLIIKADSASTNYWATLTAGHTGDNKYFIPSASTGLGAYNNPFEWVAAKHIDVYSDQTHAARIDSGYDGANSYISTPTIRVNTLKKLDGSDWNFGGGGMAVHGNEYHSTAFASSSHTHGWTSGTITGIPASFPSEQHNHPASEVVPGSPATLLSTSVIPTITHSMTDFANQPLNTGSDVTFNYLHVNPASGEPLLRLSKNADIKLEICHSAAITYPYYRGSASVITSTDDLLVLEASGGVHIYGGDLMVRGGYHVIPEGTWDGSYYEGGYVGNSTRRWYGAYIRYIWTEGPGGTYDAFDDLELVKQWGETNPVITEKYDKSKIKPPTDDIFAFLRGKDAEGNCLKHDCIELGSLGSFALGCSKALAKKQDEHSAILLQLLNDKEALEAKCRSMQEQIEKLKTTTTGVNKND